MLNLYEIFIICHCQCQKFWEPTLTNCKHFNFHFQKQIMGKKNQKCIVSNIHLNATLPVYHGYCSHVAMIGFWGWFVVVEWKKKKSEEAVLVCSVCMGFVCVFILAGFCFCFFFFFHKRWECFF